MCVGPEIAALASLASAAAPSLATAAAGTAMGAAGALYNNRAQNDALEMQNQQTQMVLAAERAARESESLRQDELANRQARGPWTRWTL